MMKRLTFYTNKLLFIGLFSLSIGVCLNACVHGSDEGVSLREAFIDPPSEFRPLIITHAKAVQDPSVLDWLDERRAGGTVLDVGVRPRKAMDGEHWLERRYMDDPGLFEGLRQTMGELKKRGRQIWIYDELGYPSGSAGGRVLEGHPEYQAWAVSCRTFISENGSISVEVEKDNVEACMAIPVRQGNISSGEKVDLTDHAREGSFRWYVPEGEWKVFLLERFQPDTWMRHNVQRRNVNIMDRDAIARFIEITHERYATELGPQLQDVELFFTDEPQFGATEPWIYGKDEAPPAVQWCDELPGAFQAKKGYSVVEALPALFDDVGPETGRYRYDFYDVQSDLVAENYFGQLEDWCHEHGVLSSGHLLLEESLLHHLMWTGSFVKNWSRMDLPGVDLLLSDPSKVDPELAKKSLPGDDPRYKTMGGWHDESVVVNEDFSCKMAASIARLTGKQGVFTESFALAQNATLPRVSGVTAWQFASGITHMSTYGIQNELSAEDYASFADFAGRLALLCRRGKAVTNVAVLVPEASVWASYNPPDGGMFPHYIKCNQDAIHIDHVFRETCHQLSAHQRDYEILSENLLQEATIDNGKLQLAGYSFSILILPEARMLHETTLDKVEEFVQAGGHVAFVGSLPSQNPAKGMDAEMTARAEALLASMEDHSYHATSPEQLDKLIVWMGNIDSPAVQWDGAPDIRLLHRREDNREIFLLANPGLKNIEGTFSAEFRGMVSIWDPASGGIENLGKHKAGDAIQVLIPAESARFVMIE
jgi:hypothetical protein